MGVLTFDGVTSDELGLIIDGYPSRGVAQRKVSKISIPGRNGDLIVAQDAYENVTEPYMGYWVDTGNPADNDLKFQSIVQWLKDDGYYRLIDSDFPSYFWMARALSPSKNDLVNYRDCFHSIPLVFDRKPQCFLISGEEEIIFDAPEGQSAYTGWYTDTISNPTSKYSRPLIEVTAINSGSAVTINVGGKSFSATYGSTFLIDCERELCSYNGIYINANTTGPYPQLPPGDFTINLRNVSTITIIPRWWER